MQIVQRACTLSILILFVHICKSRHIHAHTQKHTHPPQTMCVSFLNPGPASWWGSMQINSYKRHSPHPFIDWPMGSSQAAALVCYARVLLLLCMLQYVCRMCARVCLSVYVCVCVCVCVRISYCTLLQILDELGWNSTCIKKKKSGNEDWETLYSMFGGVLSEMTKSVYIYHQ